MVDYSEPIECGHCLNRGPMEIMTKHRTEGYVYEEHNPYELNPWVLGKEWGIYEILRCFTCNELTARYTRGHDLGSEPEEKTIVLYPQEIHLHSSIPVTIQESYIKACKYIKRADSVPAGVYLRRTLEFIFKEQGAQGNSLYLKIKELADDDKLPKTITDMAHKLRIFTNSSAHTDDDDPSPEEILIMQSICELIMMYIYQAPALLKEAEQRLTERKELVGSSSK